MTTRTELARRFAAFGLVLSVGASIAGCFLLPNEAPIAVLRVDRTEGSAPLEIRFDASGSADEDGIVTTWRWSFGDGTSSHGAIVSHIYSVPGTYLAELTVIDDDHGRASAQCTIVVHEPNMLPVATFSATPSTAATDQPIQFDASGSFDPDGLVAQYLWDFGDGSIGSGVEVVHRYALPGTFLVTLTVVDGDGGRATDAESVQVADVNAAPIPEFTFDPPSAEPGEPIRFDASGSSDPDGTIAAYAWQFGDGGQGAGVTVEHVYAAAGTYRVVLTVTDNAGASRSTSQYVTIGSGGGVPGGSGETLNVSFSWTYGILRRLTVEIPVDLLAYYQSQPRTGWSARDYDEYVLDPLDDKWMVEVASHFHLSDYYETVENALFFVQQCIEYQLDPGRFEYPRYPMETLAGRVGDCEDTAILYASIIRTLGHGALLVAVDTDGDGYADHMAVLVPVDQAYIDRFPPGSRSFWEIDGRLYAFAETAVEGGSLELGVDPWGLDTGDVTQTWDVAGASSAPKRVHATR